MSRSIISRDRVSRDQVSMNQVSRDERTDGWWCLVPHACVLYSVLPYVCTGLCIMRKYGVRWRHMGWWWSTTYPRTVSLGKRVFCDVGQPVQDSRMLCVSLTACTLAHDAGACISLMVLLVHLAHAPRPS